MQPTGGDQTSRGLKYNSLAPVSLVSWLPERASLTDYRESKWKHTVLVPPPPPPSFLLQIVHLPLNRLLISFIFLPSVRDHFGSPIVIAITGGFISPPVIGWALQGLSKSPRWHDEIKSESCINLDGFPSCSGAVLCQCWLVIKDILGLGKIK